MSLPKLLKEYIKLVVETEGATLGGSPFTIRGPVKKGNSGEYAIYRDFPLMAPPEMMAAMKVTPDEMDENGAIVGEHEILIDVDVSFTKGSRGSYEEPPEPHEWILDSWTVESIDGFMLSAEDAQALKAYLGDLNDDEMTRIEEAWLEDRRNDGPDYEPDYDWD